MKKIFLIIIIFFVSGCYDYKEVNDLAFISSIGIDYDNEYKLTYEILNSTNADNSKSYIIKDSGKTISEAFDNIALKIPKKAYYNHLKVIIINKDLAINKFKELCEYIVRNPKIRNEFYLIISNDANEILNSSNEHNPIVSDTIIKLIENAGLEYNIAYNKPFEDILEKTLNPHYDALTTEINLNGENIGINGIAIIKNYRYQETLDKDNSALINILINNKNNILLTSTDKGILSIKINNSNLNYIVDKRHYDINISSEGTIIQNLTDLDLRKPDSFDEINQNFQQILEEKINYLINYLVDKDYDVLGFNELYYKKYKENKYFINDIDFNVNVKLKINKKGLIFNE